MTEHPESNGTDQDDKQPVDRGRRFKFIAWVTGFCLISALSISFLAGIVFAPEVATPLLDIYVRGVLGIASATILAYVSGSVIDYNGGLAKIFTGKAKE